jgi:hypothetical protein
MEISRVPTLQFIRLLCLFHLTLLVSDTNDFIKKVSNVAKGKGAKIKNLVIASHGGPGHFYFGNQLIDEDQNERLSRLRVLIPLLAEDADVYVLACRTGQDQALLMKMSWALGGVRVHGYTDYIRTTSYGLFVTLDDGVNAEAGGHEVVCLRNKCSVAR